MFTILIEYATGDSCYSEDATEPIGACWSDLEKAKKALTFIKEHYNFCKEHKRCYTDTAINKALRKAKRFPWCVDNPKDLSTIEHQLKVEVDDGSMQIIHAFWHGYFEQLHWARIVLEDSEDLIFETDAW